MDKIVEYIIINKDLGMSTGKMIGQAAHVQTLISDKIYQMDLALSEKYGGIVTDEKLKGSLIDTVNSLYVLDYFDWLLSGSQTKIILKGKEKDLLKAIEIGGIPVKDNGLTEIPKGSLTAVGFLPQPKSQLQHFTKRLQLL